MSARIVMAERNEVMDALGAHVCQVHGRARRLFHHGHSANESRSGTLYIVPGMKSSMVVSGPLDLIRTR
jgi:hypothetical protein